MGENSAIEWTDHTFNPWIGCQKVSTGCKYCYAERDMTRKTRWANTWGPLETSERLKTKTWDAPIRWDRKAKVEGVRAKVFCASLADVFECNDQLLNWRFDLWNLIEETLNLDWMLLTKRPENILDMVPWKWKHGKWPDHVWIGISAENRDVANERIPLLLQIPAAVRFMSAEPLLGSIDFVEVAYAYKGPGVDGLTLAGLWDHLHWVIVGGESGPKARPMHPAWIREIRDQCFEAKIPFFFKQWGEWIPNLQGCDADIWFKAPKYLQSPLGQNIPADLLGTGDVLMARVGRARTGRLLDGREWNEFPNGGHDAT